MDKVFKKIEHFAEKEGKKVLAGAKVVAGGVVADTEDKVAEAVVSAVIVPDDEVDGSGNPVPAAPLPTAK